MKQLVHSILAVMGTTLILAVALSQNASANDRQQCLNDCTQAGATQHQKCQADYAKEMIRCGQLATNQERNMCKRQANETLKMCNESARQQVKQCQQACPPKR